MTWKYLQQETKNLRDKIDYLPETIVAVARGGVIPARLLATQLKVQEMYFISLKKIGNTKKVTSEIKENIKNRKILLVEDSLETGKTLVLVKEYLEKKGAKVKTACFYFSEQSEIIPDYYLRQVNKIPKFPWEK